MGLDSIHTEVSDIADSDWLDGICASYQPTRIVDDLWIIPSWSDPVEADAMNVKLEPGLAFGTGVAPVEVELPNLGLFQSSDASPHQPFCAAGTGLTSPGIV